MSWQIVNCYYSAESHSFSLLVTRLQGKYRGARFGWAFDNTSTPDHVNRVSCAEITPGTVFNGQKGDFCAKVMKGTPNSANTAYIIF